MRMLSDQPVLGAIHYERGFAIDGLLLAIWAQLRGAGVRLGGLLQESVGERGTCAASVQAVDLRSGRTFSIWEPRGACACGCRLDERGLLDAEPNLMSAVAERVDLLVINRFGRAESLGRGLLGVFGLALEAGVPVLTAVRSPYQEAWRGFHGGLAEQLPCRLEAVLAWYSSLTGRRQRDDRMGFAAAAAFGPTPRT
jgi:molybdate transport system ATP-binding protein